MRILSYTVLELIWCSFSFLRQIILFSWFHLSQNGLIDFLITTKGSHFLSKFTFYIKIYAIMHGRLNLMFGNFKSIFQRTYFLTYTSNIFFLYLMVFCLKWYLHFKHFSLLGLKILSFNIWSKKYLSIRSSSETTAPKF